MYCNSVEEFIDLHINQNVRYDILFFRDKQMYIDLYNVAKENMSKPEYQNILGCLYK